MKRLVQARLLQQLGDDALDDPGDDVSNNEDDQEGEEVGQEAEEPVESLLDAVGDVDCGDGEHERTPGLEGKGRVGRPAVAGRPD
jgi:hypothetical protein